MSALLEVLPAGSLEPGDEVKVGPLGLHVVWRVLDNGDGLVRVVYFRRGEGVFENRASAERGWHVETRLVLLSLAPLRPAHGVRGRRGDVQAADDLFDALRASERARGIRTWDD